MKIELQVEKPYSTHRKATQPEPVGGATHRKLNVVEGALLLELWSTVQARPDPPLPWG